MRAIAAFLLKDPTLEFLAFGIRKNSFRVIVKSRSGAAANLHNMTPAVVEPIGRWLIRNPEVITLRVYLEPDGIKIACKASVQGLAEPLECVEILPFEQIDDYPKVLANMETALVRFKRKASLLHG